tara:strand:- start:3285 stop:4085 length:801 start_codon:yes stop_codon:yes gene_type:complete
MKISSIVLLVFFTYFLVVVYMYFNQRKLMYLPSENNYLDEEINFKYQEIFIKVDKSIELKSWLIEKDLIRKKTLVFFHGNAGNLSNRVYKLNELNKLDINILIVAWRSFSGNSGEPSEINLYNDAKKTIEWLNSKGVDNKKIILYGESLGTGVAVELAQNNLYSGIILEAPYTSMVKAAKRFYPWLPIKILLKDKFNSESKIKNIRIPILIMHGEKDTIVPFDMGKKLYEKANSPKKSYFTKDDDHMMTFNPELVNAIKDFIFKRT